MTLADELRADAHLLDSLGLSRASARVDLAASIVATTAASEQEGAAGGPLPNGPFPAHANSIDRKCGEFVEFGPLAWFQLAWIVYQLIRELRRCRQGPAEAIDRARSLGRMDAWRLKRLIRKSGYVADAALAEKQVAALLKAIDEDEAKAMFREAPDG